MCQYVLTIYIMLKLYEFHDQVMLQQHLLSFDKIEIMQQKVIFLLFIISFVIGVDVSLSNLVSFFNNTLDSSHDGFSTLQEFVQYYRFIEPEHNLTKIDIQQTFDIFDSNSDQKVTLKELVDISQIKINYYPGHKQIHLGLTGQSDEMQVMWVSNPQSYDQPVILYGLYPSQLNQKVHATSSTYNVGHIGFHGKIYRGVMNNLINQKRYYYKVGDLTTHTFSDIKYFKALPPKNIVLPQINFAVCGDVGTFAPFGHLVLRQIARDNFQKSFNFMFLTGDIAYAGMNSQKTGQVQPIWDLFGELAQPFTAYIPFVPGVGNHEKYYNYTAYFSRYVLPRKFANQSNLWFSFDYGQLHIAYISSQHPYTEGSQQYNFLQNDLKEANSNPSIKWIIVGAHRSFYYSDVREHQDISNLAKALEDLLNKYKVDIVQTGHMHHMQRSWPLYKGKVEKQQHDQNHFYSPKSPIYVVQGTGGALIHTQFIDPIPEWSLKRIGAYGYGKVRISGNSLRYQYISAINGRILDEWYISK